MQWAYGLTTVPERKDDILPRTLKSLADGGFESPRLFVDGCANYLWWRSTFNLEVTCRKPQIRTFGNWILGLAELYIREPYADRYAMFQDDFVTYRNLRQYLEWCTYPDGQATPDKGYWNLYTFPRNQALAPKNSNGGTIDGWFESNQLGKGAVALVFCKEAVKILLENRHFIIDRPEDIDRPGYVGRGWRAIDGGIVSALKQAGWKEYCHTPSLVQHTGMKSSMGNRTHPLAESFRGESFDALQLLSCS